MLTRRLLTSAFLSTFFFLLLLPNHASQPTPPLPFPPLWFSRFSPVFFSFLSFLPLPLSCLIVVFWTFNILFLYITHYTFFYYLLFVLLFIYLRFPFRISSSFLISSCHLLLFLNPIISFLHFPRPFHPPLLILIFLLPCSFLPPPADPFLARPT